MTVSVPILKHCQARLRSKLDPTYKLGLLAESRAGPVVEHLDHIRDLLTAQTELERHSEGCGDTEVMKLCCVLLLNAGMVSDVLTIWRAKSSSWDASCSIDVQLLCGGGPAETKAYLAAEGSEDAACALDHIRQAEVAGDFTDFTVEGQAAWYTDYYRT